MNFLIEIIRYLLDAMTLIIIFWMTISMVLSNFKRKIYHFFDDTNSLHISITFVAILYSRQLPANELAGLLETNPGNIRIAT